MLLKRKVCRFGGPFSTSQIFWHIIDVTIQEWNRKRRRRISNSIWNLTDILTGEPSLYGKKEGGRTIVCNALNEMKQKSMIEGRAEGGNLMIYSLVQDLILTPEVGSKHLGITVEELKNRMILCGYNFPEK